jgi:hypothetical protein
MSRPPCQVLAKTRPAKPWPTLCGQVNQHTGCRRKLHSNKKQIESWSVCVGYTAAGCPHKLPANIQRSIECWLILQHAAWCVGPSQHPRRCAGPSAMQRGVLAHPANTALCAACPSTCVGKKRSQVHAPQLSTRVFCASRISGFAEAGKAIDSSPAAQGCCTSSTAAARLATAECQAGLVRVHVVLHPAS